MNKSTPPSAPIRGRGASEEEVQQRSSRGAAGVRFRRTGLVSTHEPRVRTGRFEAVERTVVVPQGTFELHRHPERPRSTLRAWDAADAYALRWLAEHWQAEDSVAVETVALVNDGFGALACALRPHEPAVVTDSVSGRTGIAANLDRNNFASLAVKTEVSALPDQLSVVVIKVPKSLGGLEEQLHQLRPKLSPSTVILGAGMVKQIHTSTLTLFETIIGPTTTSLAAQKARLIHCTFDPSLPPPPNPWPVTWRHGGVEVVNHGGVFSAASIDIGTRFLLEHLPTAHPGGQDSSGQEAAVIVDLGCGNGVVGATVAMADDRAQLHFIDASARAVDAARLTWRANHGDRPAEFHDADRMANAVEPASADLVVVNPPFHDERAIGDATAWDMFVDSHTALRSGGELRVVGNRHLGHHTRLQKIFGNCETVASNRKFVVLSAIR